MTTGSNASRAPRTSSPCGAGERCRTANMAMSSTIAMSFIPCAASQWRCSIWSIATSSFLAAPTPLRSTLCSLESARDQRAAPWLVFWRSHTNVPARRNSASCCNQPSTTASCRISMRLSNASARRAWRCRSSSSRCPRSPSTTKSPRPWEKPHERDRQDRRRPRRTAAQRTAPARHQADLGRFGGDRRQGRLACSPLPGRARRTGDGGAKQAPAAGEAWLEKGANLLCFGPPGGGKSHLAAALGMALVEKGWRVLFTRTTDLVQKLQIARRDLALEAAIAKLDKYHLLILDDLAYVTKDQAETSVLFELISARYERRSMLITANQPFGEWGKVFSDQAMTLAAIDRIVHHATILEMNVDSYRRKEAVDKARRAGRPPTRATVKGSS